MTNDLDLEKIQKEAFVAIDNLFNIEKDSDLKDEDIFLLKEKILSLDWEYNEKDIKEILLILENLKQKYTDKLHQILISMMFSIGKFLLVAKESVPAETLNTFAYIVDFFAHLNDSTFTKEQKHKHLEKIKKKYKDFKNAVIKSQELQSKQRDEDKPLDEAQTKNIDIATEQEKGTLERENVSLEGQVTEVKPDLEEQSIPEVVPLDSEKKEEINKGEVASKKPVEELTDEEEKEIVLDLESSKEEQRDELIEERDQNLDEGKQEDDLPQKEVAILTGANDLGVAKVELQELKATLVKLENSLEQKVIGVFEKRLSRCEQILLELDDKLQKLLAVRESAQPRNVKSVPKKEVFEFEEEVAGEFKRVSDFEDVGLDFEFEEEFTNKDQKKTVPIKGDNEKLAGKDSYSFPYVQVFELDNTLVGFDTNLISNVYKISPKKGRDLYAQEVVKLKALQSFFTSLTKGMKGELSRRSAKELKNLEVDVFHYPVEVKADFRHAVLIFLNRPIIFLVGKKIEGLFLPVKYSQEKGSIFKTKLIIPELGEIEYFDGREN